MHDRSQGRNDAPVFQVRKVWLVDREPLIVLMSRQPEGNIGHLISIQVTLSAENQSELQRVFVVIDAKMDGLDSVHGSIFDNGRLIPKRDTVLTGPTEIIHHKPVLPARLPGECEFV